MILDSEFAGNAFGAAWQSRHWTAPFFCDTPVAVVGVKLLVHASN
jgi:hypothetical protein